MAKKSRKVQKKTTESVNGDTETIVEKDSNEEQATKTPKSAEKKAKANKESPKASTKREAAQKNGPNDEENEEEKTPAKKRKVEREPPSTDGPKLRKRPRQLREKPEKTAEVTNSVSKPAKKKAPTKKSATKKSKKPAAKAKKDYEVEKIIESRENKKGKKEYLVRWKGYGSKDDTWEPESNLRCPTLLTEFNEKEGGVAPEE